jgi:HK97 family phage major capsid protein
MSDRPVAGQVEERTAELSVEGRRIRSRVPFGVESRDLGGFTEVIEASALQGADLSDLVARIEHDSGGVPLARWPTTLHLDRSDGSWSFEPPQSRPDVTEAVERGDLTGSSFRMVVARDRWQGDVRHIEAIGALLDVSLVARPAYPSAGVEYRSREAPMADEAESTITLEPPSDVGGDAQEATEDRTGPEPLPEPSEGLQRPAAGLLRVEDRRGEQVGETRVMAELAAELHRVPAGESRSLTDSISIAPTAVGQVLFDKLRATAVMLKTGLRTLPIGSKAETWPTITGDVTVSTYAEGSVITPSDPQFGTITATPRKIAAITQLDNEVIDDSSPAVIGVLNDHYLKTFALRVDQQLLEGSGTAPDIRGLKNVVGTQPSTPNANGGAVTFDALMDALALLEAINVPPERVAIIGHTRNKATLRKLRSTANGEYLWESALPAMGLSPSQFFWTPTLSTNESIGTSGTVCNSIYLIDTENVIFVPRASLQIVLDRSRLFNSDQSEFRGTMRCDLMVPQPSAIVRVQGFTS